MLYYIVLQFYHNIMAWKKWIWKTNDVEWYEIPVSLAFVPAAECDYMNSHYFRFLHYIIDWSVSSEHLGFFIFSFLH